MNFPKKVIINTDITLELFSFAHKEVFFNAVHQLNDNDDFRASLQKRFKTLDKVEVMLKDAVENKFVNSGSPDYFIFYKGELAGMFEFHPLTEDDYIEMGYWIFLKFRRKGILSSIIPKMFNFTKTHFDKSKVLATTPIHNIASQGLLGKMGFDKTGKILEFTDPKTSIVSKEFEYYYYLN